REVDAAEQLLAPRLGGGMDLGDGLLGRLASPCLDGGGQPLAARSEAGRQRFEEGDPRPGGELGVARQGFAREGDAGGFATGRQQLLAQLDEVFRAGSRRFPARAGAVDQGTAALRDGLQEFAEEGGVHVIAPSSRRATTWRSPEQCTISRST